ncbi:DNA mismatch repair protein MutS [Intestinimonas massiliensis]|uniref:DNA mismatch repair protein MutS n=1 Tax=Intestinimonas massiliensis (ex Afouda et al. 2020) TaxID=1673721 RepID=A0AAW5JH52_9FIRM|nr:DNA mismatch repair protein MutS [Intestinimonas massiliensis (ex Afouda et al. 2020)]MCQ4769371.1 DNA mismatch repair protein MutS [Intestinimonas massiliensis (ex Afouda et al. 2020)]
MPADTTPMMKQYLQMKAEHPDCILMFRLGDFYEMFLEDAKLASRELDLTLTTRDRNKPEGERTPMCGVPYHSVESYIARLISKGYKVAICEQMEDPALAKGLVDRDIIRIVTPGTVIESSMLEEGRNNFLCSICLQEPAVGVCFCDISTGEVSATAFAGKDAMEHLWNELGRYAPREAVLSPAAAEDPELRAFLRDRLDCRCEPGAEDRFERSAAWALCRKQFRTGLEGLPEQGEAAVRAAGALLDYLYTTQKTDLSHLTAFQYYTSGQYMELDLTARRNLELTETMRAKEKKGSLLWVLDKTKTAMGGRLIRSWMERPLLSPVPINKRLEAVADLTGSAIARDEVAACLREVTDLERLISRVVYGTAGARDLVALAGGLGRLPRLRELLAPFRSSLLCGLRQAIDDLADLRELIGRALVEEPPFSVREGGFIKAGYNQDVDYLRDVMTNGKSMVAAIEASERDKTGIKSLKVGYNKVFGYYIEVSRANYDLVPDTYIRKQTLVNCERFITQELKDMEHTILSAQDKIVALEYELFCALREQTAARVGEIQATAAAVAQVDVLTSFAAVAAAGGYCMPTVDLSDKLDIVEGRHPVVEKVLKNALFVPNDVHMDSGENLVAVITGPNMAGKSTYMRQTALIVLMAQMGSFVPAKSAHIGIVDRVFTRVGASDDLAAGQSTFMVEMTEVAELLKNATAKSLLILDEIGRGTSTYDGMSIARAVVEYCADKRRLGCKTLFATHYHELTCLEGQIPGVKNYNIAAKKRKDDIIFLRKIVRGPADQSYGIEVAGLAGVPGRVIERARDILAELEAQGAPAPATAPARADDQISLTDLGANEVAERLRRVDVNTLTPIEAMNLLYELKQKL